MATTVPTEDSVSPHSKMLQCESGGDRVYDYPAPPEEERQPHIPVVDNVCYATTTQP